MGQHQYFNCFIRVCKWIKSSDFKIEVYSRVSSGSDSFYLYVEDGNGNVNYTTVSKSGTITINDFNGFDPSGKWKIWIVTKGTVSTSTETIKVYYTY